MDTWFLLAVDEITASGEPQNGATPNSPRHLAITEANPSTPLAAAAAAHPTRFRHGYPFHPPRGHEPI